MRSVCVLILARSYCETSQCSRISSQAFCGMMPRRAWARASPASKSRYFWIRLPSEKTRRIDSVEKMSRKTAESIAVVGISEAFRTGRGDCGGSRGRNDARKADRARGSAEPADRQDDAEQGGDGCAPADHDRQELAARHMARLHAAGPRPRTAIRRAGLGLMAPQRPLAPAALILRARVADRMRPCLTKQVLQCHWTIPSSWAGGVAAVIDAEFTSCEAARSMFDAGRRLSINWRVFRGIIVSDAGMDSW